MRKIPTVALVAGILTLAPLALRADSITNSFTVGIPSGSSLPAAIIPSGLSLFNPAQGTLTGVSLTITGSATWTSSYSSPLLLAFLDSVTTLSTNSQTVTSPGAIAINLTGTSTSTTSLGLYTGTGDYTGTLLDLSVSQLETGDTISASAPLAGKITYTFAAAVTTTPEPASLLHLGTDLLGTAILVRQRQKCGNVAGS